MNWINLLSKEKNMPYFQNILLFLNKQKKLGRVIYPQQKNIFNAFRITTFTSIKVVIIGQDPYHGPNQAHGLAFSVLPGIPLPPSLKNIHQELSKDIPEFITPKHGCLEHWGRQGVLLLNSILTVEKGKSGSHANIGWEYFTDKVIHIINIYREKIVFLLWGRYAQNKGNILDHKKHYILTTSHPSPISAKNGFFGCKHFSKTNIFLEEHQIPTIHW